jgi:hypothetical protein
MMGDSSDLQYRNPPSEGPRKKARARRGSSEVLGAVLVAVITMGAFSVYASYALNQTSNEAQSVVQSLRKGTLKQGQLLSVVYHWEKVQGTSTQVKISLYNYGYADVNVKYVFIDGVPQNSFNLFALDGKQVSTVKVGSVTNLVVDVPYAVNPIVSGQSYEAVLVTDDNLVYSWGL